MTKTGIQVFDFRPYASITGLCGTGVVTQMENSEWKQGPE